MELNLICLLTDLLTQTPRVGESNIATEQQGRKKKSVCVCVGGEGSGGWKGVMEVNIFDKLKTRLCLSEVCLTSPAFPVHLRVA